MAEPMKFFGEFEEQVMEASEVDIERFLPALMPDDCQASRLVTRKPDPIEFIVNCAGQPMIPRGAVGAMTGEGGVGKTTFISCLIAAGTGSISMAPFTFKPDLKVLCLYLEDPESVIYSNLWDITGGKFEPGLYLQCLPGEFAPLMHLEENNPSRSEAFHWLDETLSNFTDVGLDLLILDPKSRVYGLVENANEHETAFVSALEYLARKHNITIIITHHINKEGQKKNQSVGRMTAAMIRGGSAFVDGCRFAMGLRRIPEKILGDFDVKNPHEFVEFDLVKSNYAPQLKVPFYFRRETTGFKIVNFYSERLDRIADAFVMALKADGGEYSKRELIKESTKFFKTDDAPSLFERIEEIEPTFTRARDMVPAIQRAIESKRVETVSVKTGKTTKDVLKITLIGNMMNGGK